MRNLHKEFTDIFPDPPLQIGEVTAIDAGGDLATVQLPGGGVLQVRGKAEFLSCLCGSELTRLSCFRER